MRTNVARKNIPQYNGINQEEKKNKIIKINTKTKHNKTYHFQWKKNKCVEEYN